MLAESKGRLHSGSEIHLIDIASNAVRCQGDNLRFPAKMPCGGCTGLSPELSEVGHHHSREAHNPLNLVPPATATTLGA